MQRVVFVVYPGFELLDLSGPAAVFNGANQVLASRGRPQRYDIDVASGQGGRVASSCGIAIGTLALGGLAAGDACRTDLLLVVGAEREPLLAAMADPAIRDTLPVLAGTARRIGSVCTGSFVLAVAGLLEGHRVATHWDGCAPLARAFPGLSVDPDALYVEDGRVWTSAGVTTGIDMALAIVTRDLDAGIAGAVAKRLVLYARRPGHQSQFSPVLRAQMRADSPFAELIGWIQAHLDAPLDVPVLAERAGLSERTFHRRFFSATGQTPARFVEAARLDAARILLSRGTTLKRVAAQVGLFPASRLARAFERRFGLSPRLYREMHADA